MSTVKRIKEKGRLPPFVPLTWDMLNSEAYKELPASAAKALPYFLGKVKLKNYYDAARYTIPFNFSYPEAMKLGFSKGTHFRTICKLIELGLIDPCKRGGLRGMGYSCSEFRLSLRWIKYGTPEFIESAWQQFQPKAKAIPKMEPYKSKTGTGLLENRP